MATANKIQLVSNRVERAKSFLLAQFRDKPNILAIVETLVEEIQEFENGIIDIQDARTLNGSFGIWLDEIGKRNGVSRGNYGDNDYKNAIKLAMSRRYSSGQVDSILRIVELLTNDSEVTMRNDAPYLLELTSYFWCLADSPEGLEALAAMFPVNTRVRFVRRDGFQLTFNVDAKGFGSDATINDLIYVKQGIAADPRFTAVSEQVIPPPILTGVANLSPPLVAGTASVGGVLTCSTGVWIGDDPIIYTYQWFEGATEISGATTDTLTILVGMDDKEILCVVGASNSFSSASVSSNSVLIVGDPVVENPLVDGIGLRNIYKTEESGGETTVFIACGITFESDGTITFNANDTTPSNWISTETNIGADYTVSYQALSGPLLNIPPNTEVAITSGVALTLHQLVPKYAQTLGEYIFTIRNIATPTIFNTGTCTISLEHDI